MASRRKGRILAFQALYAWDVGYCQTGNVLIPEDLSDFPWAKDNKQLDLELETFSRLLLSGTVENIAAVDSMIGDHLQNWGLERLNQVDRAILRMSVYTLMFQSDMPPSIVIDEAIEISKEFGTDDSYRFVNGVLDAVLTTINSKGLGSVQKNPLEKDSKTMVPK